MGERDRDAMQRDMHKFQTDREHLRKLGELALASSLNSLPKNQPNSSATSERALNLNVDRSAPAPPERDASSSHHYQRTGSMVIDRSRYPDSTATLTAAIKHLGASKSSKELDYGSVRLRKQESVNEKRMRNSTIETTESGFLKYEDVAAMMSGRETLRLHYHSAAIRKYEGLKEEYDMLHKRYADLVSTNSSTVFKLELAQEELVRMRKNYDEIVQEKGAAIRERNGLQQQCTAAIRQWDKALRECTEAKEQLAKVQQQRDEAMKEIHQAMAARIKATKDLSRLTEERNAAVQEYSLVMSERDSVHKEIESLQEDLAQSQKKIKALEDSKKVMHHENEKLRAEALAAVIEKERAIKECNEMRDKSGDFPEGTASPTSPSRSSMSTAPFGLYLWGSSSSATSWANQTPSKRTNSHLLKQNHLSASNSSSVSTLSHPQLKLKIDNIDQAMHEIEILRRQVDRLQHDLLEALQEIEVSKRLREWAFSEKEKIAYERESIRYLCDRLRKERDRAQSDLTKSRTDSDEYKCQLTETSKELNDLRSKLEARVKESRIEPSPVEPVNQQFLLSRDSAIDADLSECAVSTSKPKPGEVRDITIQKRDLENSEPLGIRIICDEKKNGAIFVSSVSGNSLAAKAGLHVGDQLLDVCGINMRGQTTYKVASAVLRQFTTSGDDMTMRVQFNPDRFEEISTMADNDSSGEDAEDEDEDDDAEDESTAST